MKLDDSVIARLAQIIQEALLLEIDCVDLMRAIRLELAADGETLMPTKLYLEAVQKDHDTFLAKAEKLMKEAEAAQHDND